VTDIDAPPPPPEEDGTPAAPVAGKGDDFYGLTAFEFVLACLPRD
jgi:hypothetical protein